MGAIIGAAVEGTAGALIGSHMDKQAEEMERDIENAKIERIGEGIKITFDSGILFETNSTTLQSQAKTNIANHRCHSKQISRYKYSGNWAYRLCWHR